MTQDVYGRSVAQNGTAFRVTGADGTAFDVHAASLGEAMSTINAMAPAGYQPVMPPSQVVDSLAFLNRFTPAEQAAVWQAAVGNPMIGVGLQTGLATGHVDLLSPTVRAWMDALVTANAVTALRATAILVP